MIRRVAPLIALALLTGACAWFGGGDKKMSPLTEYAATAKAVLAWQKNVGKRSPIGFAPLLQDGIVYTASENGQVVATEIATRKELWRAAIKESLSAGVGAGTEPILQGFSLDRRSGKERTLERDVACLAADFR